MIATRLCIWRNGRHSPNKNASRQVLHLFLMESDTGSNMFRARVDSDDFEVVGRCIETETGEVNHWQNWCRARPHDVAAKGCGFRCRLVSQESDFGWTHLSTTADISRRFNGFSGFNPLNPLNPWLMLYPWSIFPLLIRP